MSVEIKLPRLGWSMEQGVLVAWLKRPGEPVRAGEPLFTLEGDKAVEDIEAVDAGVLHIPADAPHPGDTVAVGTVIGFLLAAGEAPPPSVSGNVVTTIEVETSKTPAVPPAAGPAARRLARELGVTLAEVAGARPITPDDVRAHGARQSVAAMSANGSKTPPAVEGSIAKPTIVASPNGDRAGHRAANGVVATRRRGLPAISPRAARVAQEMNVDWTTLSGSGSSGRIREIDVREAAAMSATATTAEGIARVSVDQRGGEATTIDSGRCRVIQPTLLRKTIARRMKASCENTAPVTLTMRCDATRLASLRNELKAAKQATTESEPPPTYSDILGKLAAIALGQHPLLNARWDAERIIAFDDVHLGIAVDTPEGLLVPVVRDAQTLSLGQLARRSRDLVDRARSRRLSTDELQGGTFTITNLGGFGVEAFTPIINYPETAVLGIGAMIREAVVMDDGRIRPRERITLSLTFDHQVLDGADAARFLQTLRTFIESPLGALLG